MGEEIKMERSELGLSWPQHTAWGRKTFQKPGLEK